MQGSLALRNTLVRVLQLLRSGLALALRKGHVLRLLSMRVEVYTATVLQSSGGWPTDVGIVGCSNVQSWFFDLPRDRRLWFASPMQRESDLY